MKKLLALVLSIILISFSVFAVSAQAQSVDYSAEAVLTIPDTFIINIPAEIEVGQVTTINAIDINIATGREVSVSFSGLNERGGVEVYNNVDNTSAEVRFYDDNGADYKGDHLTIGTFTNDTADNTYNFYSTGRYTSDTRAGVYRGTVNFLVTCDEA